MDLSLKSLQIPLPEDIQKLKGHGDFCRADKVIRARLDAAITDALKQRLELERVLLKRIPDCYPFTERDALERMQKFFTDVVPDDLERVCDEDAADWYYIEGKRHFKRDFIENLIKTRREWEDRLRPGVIQNDKEGNFSMLDGMIQKMSEQRQVTLKMDVQMTLRVKPQFYKPGKRLQVHLPLPVEYRQVKQVKIIEITPDAVHVGYADHPQRTVCFEGVFPKNQEFRVRFSFENHAVYRAPNPEKVSSQNAVFHTEEKAPHIVFSPFILCVMQEIVGNETNPLLIARRIYDFVTTKTIYSFVRPYFTIPNIPEYCLCSRKGDCGILALTFITLCRAAGVPARWQSGLYANPLSVGNHDWAEYYIEPYGWLFADCSFGGAAYRSGNMKRWNFYSANIEPYRVPFASEFQYPMYPVKRFLRDDPYDNQNGEAEFEDGGLFDEQMERTSRIISIEEI